MSIILLTSEPCHGEPTNEEIEKQQAVVEENNALLESLRNFQHLLQSQVDGSSPNDLTMRSTQSKSSKYNRRVTLRREFFEHTLQTHYSKLLPRNITSIPMLNVQRSKSPPPVKESWMDPNSGCLLFQEDGSAYWTYHWCPRSYITQIHLIPQKSDNGITTEYKALNINKLGTFDPSRSSQSGDSDATDSDEVASEFYTNGDFCYPSHDKRLRHKVRRQSEVEFYTCQEVGEPTVFNVVEETPCQYVLRVCLPRKQNEPQNESNSPPPQGPENSQDKDVDSVDYLQLVRDIHKVTTTYAKTTGLDKADMEDPDRAISLHDALPPLPPSRRRANLELIREMFTHSYDSYMYNAYPASEIKPLTCRPGTFDLVKLPALTLIDTLDTLVIMKNFTEFARSVERLKDLHESLQQIEDIQGRKVPFLGGGIFSTNSNVSLFETNIRVMGGLLSAHQLAVAYLGNQVPKHHVRDSSGAVQIGPVVFADYSSTINEFTVQNQAGQICSLEEAGESVCTLSVKSLENSGKVSKGDNSTKRKLNSMSYWVYDGFLLDLAHDLGKRMLPAFQTKTGIPYGTVNLVDGIPQGESKVASLAGAGTLTLEFELLSRLTGDPTFGKEAKLASRALWMRRSKKGLLGKHINIERGGWTETLSGIGSNSDSFYEYLAKHYILFHEDDDFWTMFLTSYYGVHNESRTGEWYADVDMNQGSSGSSRRVFESLMAFYPGMQVLLGEFSPAARTLNSFFMVREALGLLPERFNYAGWRVDGVGASLHPLRPELLESCYFLHRATQGVPLKRASGVDKFGNSGWLWAADYTLHTIHWHTWAPCGFSSVRNVSPHTTGGIPGSQDKKNRPQAVNEMPSFFLSETLKYLYLTFDEDNLLHEDTDREWVFTTEAHPIHHEPAVQSNSGSFDSEVSRHRQRVRDMLRSHLTRSSTRIRSGVASRFKTEKWTEKSTEADFLRQLTDARSSVQGRHSIALTGSELFDIDVLQPSLLPIANEGDEFSSSQQDHTNLAHLSLGPGSASMRQLVKACVNIYSPSLGWVNALNGGVIDYSNVYVSSSLDEVPIDVKHRVGLLSASRALSLLGTGLFLGKNTVDKKNSTPATLRHSKHKRETNLLSQRFDMGGDLGEFEVSVYPEGNGFSIKRLVSGESIVATVVYDESALGTQDDAEDTSPFVMLYSSTTPPNGNRLPASKLTSSWLPDMSWKSVFRRTQWSDTNESIDAKTSRSVIIGDTSGSSFSCDVQIVRRTMLDLKNFFSDEGGEGEGIVEKEEIVTIIPCAPGLFGQTLIPRLSSSGGLEVEGVLVPPDLGNEDGCIETIQSPNMDSYPHIRMVNRGVCTFQEKSRNLQRLGATAVIVANNMQNSQELFLMAPGSNKGVHDDDFVVTVLVSGSDGQELLKLIDQNEMGSLVAKIMLTPQSIVNDESGTIVAVGTPEHSRMPILQASSEVIQIFAAGGWGVHAVGRSSGAGDESSREWQLFLLQHNLFSET